MVDKNVGINQFNSVRDFFEFACSKVNTQEGKRCFDLLMQLTDNENNIFLTEEKLYLVDKNEGIIQFDSLDNFIEYVYSNINIPAGKRYANSLLKFFDYNYDRYANNKYYTPIKSEISDDFYTVSNTDVGSVSYYSLTLISKILESQNASETLLNKLEKVPSKWNGFDSFCFRVYVWVIFPLKRLFQGQPPQPKIIKNNKITQPKEINNCEISTVPESEIKTDPNQLQEQSLIK